MQGGATESVWLKDVEKKYTAIKFINAISTATTTPNTTIWGTSMTKDMRGLAVDSKYTIPYTLSRLYAHHGLEGLVEEEEFKFMIYHNYDFEALCMKQLLGTAGDMLTMAKDSTNNNIILTTFREVYIKPPKYLNITTGDAYYKMSAIPGENTAISNCCSGKRESMGVTPSGRKMEWISLLKGQW
jgi:hypothetical protein